MKAAEPVASRYEKRPYEPRHQPVLPLGSKTPQVGNSKERLHIVNKEVFAPLPVFRESEREFGPCFLNVVNGDKHTAALRSNSNRCFEKGKEKGNGSCTSL